MLQFDLHAVLGVRPGNSNLTETRINLLRARFLSVNKRMSDKRSTSNMAKDLYHASRSRLNKSKGLVLLAEIEQLKTENREQIWRKMEESERSLKSLWRENKFGNRET